MSSRASMHSRMMTVYLVLFVPELYRDPLRCQVDL